MDRENQNVVQVAIRVPESTKLALDQVSAREHRSVGAQVRLYIERGLANETTDRHPAPTGSAGDVRSGGNASQAA